MLEKKFFHRLKKQIDLIHCLMFHILAVFDKTDGYLTWSEWWEYFDLIFFIVFTFTFYSLIDKTDGYLVWPCTKCSHRSDRETLIWFDHSLRWTQANVDDHCTLEVNKKHLLACWVWNKNFVESNAIIENNLLCFWGWKTLKACFIVNIHDANVCSLFNLGGQFKTMQHWALSKQTKRVLNVVKIKWKKLK